MSVPYQLVVVLKILLFAYFVSLALFIFQIFSSVFYLQFNYVLAVINLLFNEVEVWVVYCKTHDKPTWFTAWVWSWSLPDCKEKVTFSLTVFTIESTGSNEGTEEAGEQAGERGADCKALTGTLKNYLFFCLSSNAVKLGFHGSKRKCESIKTLFSSCAYTFNICQCFFQ